ncbi:MAG: hypothetical protein DCC65_10750 [Planctomycetota bacterium]|nr:MAG: hypothetical protein DCC65_10750 [Planctomycetota bacterium]
MGVEVTSTNPDFGEVQRRITLSKWWPGGNASFHIPNAAQWNEIERIINEDLGPFLGWKTQRELLAAVREKQKEGQEAAGDLRQLVTDYPDVLKQVVAAVDAAKLGKRDMDGLIKVMGNLADAVANANAGFRQAFLAVVGKLPKQGQRALEDLALLLEGWSLQQVASVAQQVRSRVETIDLFKKQIRDNRTYEIRGDKSIHRILERAMWLIDERYWLLQSNSTLRTFIGDEMSKIDKKAYGKKRPDFACGTVGERLIIVELKRPAHALSAKDLNQLETYLTVAESYSKYRGFEAYLVGNKKDDDLLRRLKHRSSSFKVLTYTDLIQDTETRYREFLETMR